MHHTDQMMLPSLALVLHNTDVVGASQTLKKTIQSIKTHYTPQEE